MEHPLLTTGKCKANGGTILPLLNFFIHLSASSKSDTPLCEAAKAAQRLLVGSVTSERPSHLLLSVSLSTRRHSVCSLSPDTVSRQCGSCSESRNAEGALRSKLKLPEERRGDEREERKAGQGDFSLHEVMDDDFPQSGS